MSPDRLVWADQWTRFPRVSGDEPSAGIPLPIDYEFSPRERG